MERANSVERIGPIKLDAAVQGQSAVWVVLLLLVTLIWGAAFVAVKYIDQFVSPSEMIALRFFPSALIFAAWLLPTRGRQVWHMVRTERWRFPLMALTGNILNNLVLAWGMTHVAAGTASLIIALNPAFTFALSLLFLKERFAWARALGMAIAFAGVFVIIRWGSGRALTPDGMGYAALILLAPLSFAIYTVVGKSVIARHPPLLVVGASMIFSGLFSLAFVRPSLFSVLPTVPVAFWAAVLFQILLATVFAFVVWNGALEHMPAGRVASFVYLIPLFGVAFGHWLLGEPVTAALLLGAAILIGGVWLVNRR
jgi:drug/metabolite transporter (DMT)-like permease